MRRVTERMASAQYVSTLDSLKADCAYVTEAMFESAVVTVVNPLNSEVMEVNGFKAVDRSEVIKTSTDDRASAMEVEDCEINISTSTEGENLSRTNNHDEDVHNSNSPNTLSDSSSHVCRESENISSRSCHGSKSESVLSESIVTDPVLCESESSPKDILEFQKDSEYECDLSICEELDTSKGELSIIEELDNSKNELSFMKEFDSSKDELSITEELNPSSKELTITEVLDVSKTELRILKEVDISKDELSVMKESIPPISKLNISTKSKNSEATTVDKVSTSICAKKSETFPNEVLEKSSSSKSSPSKLENEEGDDIEALLSTAISKDYVNCVWSNEPSQTEPPSGANKLNEVENKTQSIAIKNNLPKKISGMESSDLSNDADSADVIENNSFIKLVKPKEPLEAVPKPKFIIQAGNNNLSTKKTKSSDGKRKRLSSPSQRSLLKDMKSNVKGTHIQTTTDLTPNKTLSNKSNCTNLTTSDLASSKAPSKKCRVFPIERKYLPFDATKLITAKSPKGRAVKRNLKSPKKDRAPSNLAPAVRKADSNVESSPVSSSLDPLIRNLLDEEKLGQKLHASYKRIMVNRSIPMYHPPLNAHFPYEKMYVCGACGDRFALPSSLAVHISRKSALISYQCPECKTILNFDNRCSLLNHLNDHSLSVDSIDPADLFVSPPHLSELPSGMEALNAFEKCRECGNPVNAMKKHMQGNDIFDPIEISGHTARKDEFLCSKCGQVFSANCALISHMRFHEERPPFTCPECGELFTAHSILSEHMQDCCFFICKGFVCACYSKFSSSTTFEEHISRSHLMKVFMCKRCSTACATLELLKTHLLQEHSSKIDGVSVSRFYHLYISCQLCPGKLLDCYQSEKHADFHSQDKIVKQDVLICGRCKEVVDGFDKMHEHRSSCCFKRKDNENASRNEKSAHSPSRICPSAVSRKDQNVLNPASSASISITGGSKTAPQEFSIRLKKPKLIASSQNILQNQKGQSCTSSENGTSVDKTDTECVSATTSATVDGGDSDGCISNSNAGEYVNCRICKLSIAAPGDRVSVKKHFITHHQALFLQALHNGRRNQTGNDSKVVCKFPIQTVLMKEHPIKKESAQRSGKKGKLSPPTEQKKGNIATKTEVNKSSPKRVASKKIKKSSKKLETSPFKIGTVISPNKAGKNCTCYKCSYSTEDKVSFANHIITHKTNPSDLQCPLCGMCFIVRPPLEKHLLVQHSVRSVSEFLRKHGFEDESEEENEKGVKIEDGLEEEVLQENQCKVCKAKFDNSFLLEKHFRVHGGAFLLASLKAKKV